MTRVPLTLAISEYDHVTDLVTGRVPVEGVDLTCLTLQIEEIFFRAFVYRDFDASEVSMAKLCSPGTRTLPEQPRRSGKGSTSRPSRGLTSSRCAPRFGSPPWTPVGTEHASFWSSRAVGCRRRRGWLKRPLPMRCSRSPSEHS